MQSKPLRHALLLIENISLLHNRGSNLEKLDLMIKSSSKLQCSSAVVVFFVSLLFLIQLISCML